MDDISSKIEVVLFDLELASWHRRPKATLDFSDSRISAHYQYGINSPNTEVEDISSSRLRSLRIDADIAIIYAYRIPELLLLLYNPSVKFIYMQHGYYPDRIRRNKLRIFKKYDRILYYASLLIRYFLKTWNFTAIKQILGLWMIDNFESKEIPAPDICVVLDQSWANFHKRKLGWSNATYITKKFYEPKSIFKNDSFDAQYVAQTLVEDSRLSTNTLINCLNKYIRANKIKRLCIISHPRTDRNVYSSLECDYEFEDDKCFVVPTIGHYSSLLLYLVENGIQVTLLSDEMINVPDDFVQRIKSIKGGSSRLFSSKLTDCIINEEVVTLAHNHRK